MNIMLLFLSEHKDGDRAKEAVFQSDMADIEIKGIQTSDAPTKYFLQYVKQNKGKILDKIFCITSKMVKNNGLEQYKKMVAEYCRNNNLHQPEIVEIPYDYQPGMANEDIKYTLSDKVKQLYQGIVDNLANESTEKEIHIYIDYTGGLRDVNLFMVVLIRYLEFTQMKCEKVIYSNLNDKEIVSIDYIYQLFYVINGISEFLQSGNSSLLRETILSNEEIAKKYPYIKELLDSMNEFSDMMALCAVDSNMDTVLNKLYNSIEEVQKMKVSESKETEIAISMLKNLLKEIQKKLFLDQSKQLSYLQIIKWCLSNNMIQQAITFYIEKVPKIYYDNNLIVWINEESKGLTGHDEYSRQFYDILYDEIGKQNKEVQMLEVFQKIVKEIPTQRLRTNPDTLLRRFGGQLEQDEIRKISNGVKNVLIYLNIKYGSYRKTEMDNDMYEYLKQKVGETTDFEKTCNKICNDYNVQRFLLDNQMVEKENTYLKKLRSICMLDYNEENSFSNMNNRDLKEILEYYLVLKVIRNQINHASKDANEGKKAIDKYLNENEREYTTEIEICNIKTILKKAIDKTEQLIL